MRFTLVLCSILALVFPPWICSAQETTGSIEAVVVDDAGRPVPQATVSLTSPSLQGMRSAVSDDEGRIRVPALPVGTYTLRISHDVHPEFRQEDVVVQLGRVHSLGTIVLGGRTALETVVVRGRRAPLIDPSSTTLGANLSIEDFEGLPIERNYRNVALLVPMVDQSFLGDNEPNMAGGTGLDNRYFIDGADVTDPYRGITGTSLPYNFVKQVQIKTGGYEAEHRGSLGGLIDVVTYSGGNEFRGQAFGFFANNQFAGSPRQPALQPSSGDFTQFDVGMSVGGPIVRDRLWYFAAYNPTFEREDVELPGTGFHEDKSVQHLFAGKLTLKAAERARVTLTVLGDPTRRDAVGETFFRFGFGTPVTFLNPDPFLGEVTSGGVTVVLNGNVVASDRQLVEASVSTIIRDEKIGPRTTRGAEEIMFIDAQTGTISGGFPMRVDNRSYQTTGEAKWTFFAGPNTFKAGVAYKENALDADLTNRKLERFEDGSTEAIELKIKGYVRNRIPSAFVQNALVVNDDFQINAGLRWSAQFLVDSNGRTAQEITDQFQPRFGFTYQPGAPGSQKIFGSYGRFYHDISTYLMNISYVDGAQFDFINCDAAGTCGTFGGSGTIHPEIDRLQGQHYDEFSLGYERYLGQYNKVGIQAVYRTLRAAVEDGAIPIDAPPEETEFRVDNPGHGELIDYPNAERIYQAIVLSAERSGGARYKFLGSYTLSGNRGNYPGLFQSDLAIPFPNANGSFDFYENTIDGHGRLNNDRRHVFKLSGSYRLDFGLSTGAVFLWASGTPLNEFEGSSVGSPFFNFARRRGTAGTTPSIWDLNLRFAYDLPWWTRGASRQRLILDIFHLGSQRDPVNFDQVRTFGPGADANPNPTYGLATRFQPPTAVRLGFESSF